LEKRREGYNIRRKWTKHMLASSFSSESGVSDEAIQSNRKGEGKKKISK